jgi:hypothetical protein
MTFEQELRATWQAVTEISDLLSEALARLGAPSVEDGPGVRAVRGLVAAAQAGRRDDDWWEQNFPRPKTYDGWPTSGVPTDANAALRSDAQRAEDAARAAEMKRAWDTITGGGGGR